MVHDDFFDMTAWCCAVGVVQLMGGGAGVSDRVRLKESAHVIADLLEFEERASVGGAVGPSGANCLFFRSAVSL